MGQVWLLIAHLWRRLCVCACVCACVFCGRLPSSRCRHRDRGVSSVSAFVSLCLTRQFMRVQCAVTALLAIRPYYKIPYCNCTLSLRRTRQRTTEDDGTRGTKDASRPWQRDCSVGKVVPKCRAGPDHPTLREEGAPSSVRVVCSTGSSGHVCSGSSDSHCPPPKPR